MFQRYYINLLNWLCYCVTMHITIKLSKTRICCLFLKNTTNTPKHRVLSTMSKSSDFINVRLSPDLKRKLDSVSYSRTKLEQRRVTLSEIVRETLEQIYPPDRAPTQLKMDL